MAYMTVEQLIAFLEGFPDDHKIATDDGQGNIMFVVDAHEANEHQSVVLMLEN